MAPASLRGATGIAIGPEDFLDLLAPAVDAWEERLADEGFAPLRAAWLARASRIGEEITARLPDRALTGRFETIDAIGRAGARDRRGPGGAAGGGDRISRRRAMLLAIDVGNTNMVFALHDGERVVAEWRCRTERQRTADEYFVWLEQLMDHAGIEAEVRSVVISSVVPQVVFNLRVLADRYFHTRPLVVGKPEVKLGVPVRVDPHTTVGADRLVNTVGAWDRYGGDLIVVDFGTATTFDVVDFDGAYVGGVIAPGVNLSLKALHDAAAALALHRRDQARGRGGDEHRRLHAVGDLLGICRPHRGALRPHPRREGAADDRRRNRGTVHPLRARDRRAAEDRHRPDHPWPRPDRSPEQGVTGTAWQNRTG